MISPILKLKDTTKIVETNKYKSLSHEILLTGCNGDLKKFPDTWDVKAKMDCYNNSGQVLMLEAFWESLQSAVNHIFILDSYFLNPETPKNINKAVMIENRVSDIQNKLTDACTNGKNGLEIKILTDSPYTNDIVEEQKMLDDFSTIEEMTKENTQQGQTGVELSVCLELTRKFNYIHDRFAIIDNELWHFGGTVGGFNSKLSVASRGWDAESLGAIRFFNEVWQTCSR